MSTDSFHGLARALSELQTQWSDIQKREGELQARVASLTSENADLRRDLERAELAAAEEKIDAASVRETLDGARAENRRLQNVVTELRDQISETHAQLSQTKNERRQIESRLKDVVEKYRALHSHFAKARAVYAELQKTREHVKSLEGTLVLKTAERADVDKLLAAEREKVARLAERCEEWQEELEAAGGKYAALEKKFTEHRSLIERWVHAYRGLERKLEKVHAAGREEVRRWQAFAQQETHRANAAENELRDFRAWNDNKESHVGARLAKTEIEKNELVARLVQLTAENQAIKDAQVRLNADHHALREAHAHVKAENELWRRRAQDAEDLGDRRARRAQAEAQDAINDLKTQLRDQRETFQRAIEETQVGTVQRRKGRVSPSPRAAQNLENSIREANKKANEQSRVIDLIEKFSKDFPGFEDTSNSESVVPSPLPSAKPSLS